MAVVKNFENVVARSSTGEIREAPTYKRTFTVRCDDPDTSMVDIANATGITYGDPHPHDGSCFVTTVDVDADGDSMLIYTVSYGYTRPVNNIRVTGGTPEEEPEDPVEDPDSPPDPTKIPQGYWTGGSSLETRQSSTTIGYGQDELWWVPKSFGEQVRMTNGRPLTSGVVVDFASEQLVLTNFYESYDDVKNIGLNIDRMNNDYWPVGEQEDCYKKLAWKIVSYNWSFKQESSEQKTLKYYEVQVTFKRSRLVKYEKGKHILQGFPPDLKADIEAERMGLARVDIPSTLPMIASAGFQECVYPLGLDGKEDYLKDPTGLTPIKTRVKYYNCDGEEIPNPNGEGVDPDSPCAEFPYWENTTEEVPLDKNGKAVPPRTEGAIIVPWTEEYPLADFEKLFGNGPPFKPKATTT